VTDFALDMGFAELKLGADARLNMIGSSATGVVICGLGRTEQTEAQAHAKKKTAFELVHSHTPYLRRATKNVLFPWLQPYEEGLAARLLGELQALAEVQVNTFVPARPSSARGRPAK
jgi:hypothetical protein